MMSKYIIATAFIAFSISISPATAQKKLVKKLIHKYLSNEQDSVRKNTLFPFPVISLSPETGIEYGAAAIYSFYLDKSDTLTRVSTLDFMGTHTTHNQSKLKLVADVWSRQNKYHYNAEIRYRNFPYNFYGIGAHTKAVNKESIKEQKFKMVFSADRLVAKHYYLGLLAGFEHYKNTGTEPNGIFSANTHFGKAGGKYAYLGIEQIFDTRNNITYTTQGLYAKLSLSYSPDIFSGENFTGFVTHFDGRYFTPLSSKVTLAFNGNYQNISGAQIPFYLLAQLGGESMMRGYYQGRFRDKNMAALQTELRYRFVPRFGVVAFGGAGTVFGETPFRAANIKPNYGLGLRYFFDLNKGLSVRIDYGLGEKLKNEKRFSGFYFSMSEAF